MNKIIPWYYNLNTRVVKRAFVIYTTRFNYRSPGGIQHSTSEKATGCQKVDRCHARGGSQSMLVYRSTCFGDLHI